MKITKKHQMTLKIDKLSTMNQKSRNKRYKSIKILVGSYPNAKSIRINLSFAKVIATKNGLDPIYYYCAIKTFIIFNSIIILFSIMNGGLKDVTISARFFGSSPLLDLCAQT
jgi:hypothetical protein